MPVNNSIIKPVAHVPHVLRSFSGYPMAQLCRQLTRFSRVIRIIINARAANIYRGDLYIYSPHAESTNQLELFAKLARHDMENLSRFQGSNKDRFATKECTLSPGNCSAIYPGGRHWSSVAVLSTRGPELQIDRVVTNNQNINESFRLRGLSQTKVTSANSSSPSFGLGSQVCTGRFLISLRAYRGRRTLIEP